MKRSFARERARLGASASLKARGAAARREFRKAGEALRWQSSGGSERFEATSQRRVPHCIGAAYVAGVMHLSACRGDWTRVMPGMT